MSIWYGFGTAARYVIGVNIALVAYSAQQTLVACGYFGEGGVVGLVIPLRFPTSPQAADDGNRLVCHDVVVRTAAQ